uniref:CD96 molecule n=1 Tax=Calidris pygmaea TaxID=425635 RepID=A0A8C3KE39_9CHAR
MEKRWLLSLFCLLSVPSITGKRVSQTPDVITQTEVVHALPGTDVTLMCTFPKPHTAHIIQTQWSKTDDNQLNRIAVYHPVYGTHYFTFPEASYGFSVSFSMRNCCDWNAAQVLCPPNPNAAFECNQWTLYLKNVTLSLNGQYECSFATYPYGTKAATIQLIVKAEEEQHYLKEVWLNQTLEIPCLEDLTSENLSNYPLKWLVVSIFHLGYRFQRELQVYRDSSALDRQRVHLGLNNALKIFPTKITDDARVFSCHVVYHPERVRKSSTTVRVFGKGLMPTAHLVALGKVTFPSHSEDTGAFYIYIFTLLFFSAAMSQNTFSCVCLFSFLRNETWNISSEEIFVSFGRFFIDRTHLKHKMQRTANTCILCYLKYKRIAKSMEALLYKSITQLELSGSAQSLGSSAWEPGSWVLVWGCVVTRTLPRGSSDPQAASRFPSSLRTFSGTKNTKASRFPWPTVVAVLLLFCSLLIALGIRKWCQYQKEIMNRPPSFKPPPPPIKYASMVESDGTPPSCHELENL